MVWCGVVAQVQVGDISLHQLCGSTLEGRQIDSAPSALGAAVPVVWDSVRDLRVP